MVVASRLIYNQEILLNSTDYKKKSFSKNFQVVLMKILIAIVITAKRKGQSMKLALNIKILTKSIHKNKFYMPIIEMLRDLISQHLTTSQNGPRVFFFNYRSYVYYSQLIYYKDTGKHCNFNINCGVSTSTSRFKTGCNGLTSWPDEVPKAMNYNLKGLKNTYLHCLLDDFYS